MIKPIEHRVTADCLIVLFVTQVEGHLAAATIQHDLYVAEAEGKVETATNAIDVVKQEKQQLLRQLEEKQRYCSECDAGTTRRCAASIM